MEAESLGSNLKTTCEQNLKALLTHCKAEMNKNPTTQLSIISDDQSDSDEVNMTRDDQKWHVNQTDSSNLKNLTSSIIKEKSFALNNNSTVSNVDDNHVKKVRFHSVRYLYLHHIFFFYVFYMCYF